ncbi:MAG: hypothetical protein HQL89_01650 [Magnetococcales bacterium]|nr:hypothetical protein [Magnetococcales bacterium]
MRDCPQDFDFVFHAPCVFCEKAGTKARACARFPQKPRGNLASGQGARGKTKSESKPWGQSLKPPFFFQYFYTYQSTVNHSFQLTNVTEQKPEGLGVGADVYLHKPCAIEELIAVVKKGLLESKKQYTLKQEHADLKKKWLQFEEELERLRLAGVGVGMEDHFAMETRVSWVELVDDVGSGSR